MYTLKKIEKCKDKKYLYLIYSLPKNHNNFRNNIFKICQYCKIHILKSDDIKEIR